MTSPNMSSASAASIGSAATHTTDIEAPLWDQKVRRSVVRICFDWMKEEEGYEVMVIPGIILSVDNGSATVAANSTFFRMNLERCVVNFPNSTGGYEDGIILSNDSVVIGDQFCTFTLRPRNSGYIEPVKFEIQPVNEGDRVNSFVFPRENYITPTAYPGGFILLASKSILIHDCRMHEYGYLGSPLFNLRLDIVGITYLDKGQLQAWTVSELQGGVLNNTNSTFVSNGKSLGDPPIAEAQVEE